MNGDPAPIHVMRNGRRGRGRPDADSSATAIAVLPLTEGRTGLAVAAGASPVRILDLADGEVAAPYLRCWSDRLAAVPIPRQRRWVLAAGGVGSDQYYLAVWDPRLGKPISTPIPGRPDPPTALAGAAGPAGTGLLVTSCSGEGGVIRRWDGETGAPVGAPLVGHDGGYSHELAVLDLPDWPVLISDGHDRTARLWSLWDGEAGPVLRGHANVCSGVGDRVAPAGRPGVGGHRQFRPQCAAMGRRDRRARG